MFTGIVQGVAEVLEIIRLEGACQIRLKLPDGVGEGLVPGASVSVDGVCLTCVTCEGSILVVDIMHETLRVSSLGSLSNGDFVNVERSAKDGAEIGGHPTSGHVDCTVEVVRIETPHNNFVLTVRYPAQVARYIFEKGYVALNGASLTVCNHNKAERTFDVWLIPETLRLTTFSRKVVGSSINLEIERATQVAVDTMRDFLQERLGPQLEAFEALMLSAQAKPRLAGEG